MWSSKGRSGYGDSTIGGDYDSWDGVSLNGRQYKNEITQETRDLSGADYWHMRKQNRPTEAIPASLHMLSKDRANIDAYAALDEPVKKKSSVSLVDKILPQQRRVLTLTQQMIDLEAEYKQRLHNPEEYTLLRNILSCKRSRAQELLKKAVSVKKPEPIPSDDTDSLYNDEQYAEDSLSYNDEKAAQNVIDAVDTPTWLLNTNPSNCLRNPLIKACQTYKTLVRWAIKTKHYINDLKAV
jgi:hypothetical protein